ncbi:hypothetical protein ACHQM5_006621 [Ranunculus cassubicifolius]
MCSSSASQSQLTTSASNGIQADFMNTWEKVLQTSEDVVLSDEVDSYLIDRLEANDKSTCFDILNWWKVKGKISYPTLALVAKDILAIQVSTVASESAFSTGGRVIDPFRSSLTPKSVEALICYQNWLTSEDISNIEYEASEMEMEFYLEMEKEHENAKAEASRSTSQMAVSQN